jgi:hypothetical protein
MTLYLVSNKPIAPELVAEVEGRYRAFAERVEKNPWTHRLRAAKLEAAQTRSDQPLIAFEQQVFAARRRGDPWLTGQL